MLNLFQHPLRHTLRSDMANGTLNQVQGDDRGGHPITPEHGHNAPSPSHKFVMLNSFQHPSAARSGATWQAGP
jgi:hypothetical protein